MGGATQPEAQPVRGGSAHTAPARLPELARSHLRPEVRVAWDPRRGLPLHLPKRDPAAAPGTDFDSSAACGVSSAAGPTAPAADAPCAPGPGLAAATAQLAGV